MSERDTLEAVTSMSEDSRTENVPTNELNDVAGLLAESHPQRTRALTTKGLSYWMETRDLRRKNQDRYRDIIEGHIERIYDILKTGEGTEFIDELLAKITRSYQDYARQFDSKEEQMSDPLFLRHLIKSKPSRKKFSLGRLISKLLHFLEGSLAP